MLNSNTAAELIVTGDEMRSVLRKWYGDLQQRQNKDDTQSVNGRAWRAEMRRAEPPYGVVKCEGYHVLRRRLAPCMPLWPVDELALAVFASVAIHIKWDNSSRSFAAQLGETLKSNRCLSALRFDRLQQSDSPETLCRQLVRAVKIRGNDGVNIVSLADGILQWMREYYADRDHQPVDISPFQRVHIRWANEYLSSSK